MLLSPSNENMSIYASFNASASPYVNHAAL